MKKILLWVCVVFTVSSAASAGDIPREFVDVSSNVVLHLFGQDLITNTFDADAWSYSPAQLWAGGLVLPQSRRVAGVAVNMGWRRHGVPDLYGAGFGLLNISSATWGVQAGVMNVSEHTCGLQAGLVGVADNMRGFQLSALFSVSDESYGLQAGVINVSDKVYGLQAGIVNICDHLHGVQIGALNIAGTGVLPIMVGLNVGF